MILPILISAVLYYLSFPNFISLYGFSWLAWVFAIPLFICFEEKKFWGRTGSGFLFGFAANLAAVNWMIPYSLPGYFLLSLVLASQGAIFAALYRPLKGRPVMSVLSVAGAWVVSEYFRKVLMLGESWNLAHTQTFDVPLMQVSGVLGSSAVSFLLIAVNYALYLVLRSAKDLKMNMRAILAVVVLLAVAYGYGFMRLVINVVPVKPVNICVLQTDQDYHGDLTDDRVRKIVEANIVLTWEAVAVAREKPDLIVWPETAIPTDFLEDLELRMKMAALAQETGSYLLVGAAIHDEAGQHNSAVLLNSRGEVQQIYHKRHLIPLTEFVPRTWFWKMFASIFHVESPALVEGQENDAGMMEIRLRDGRTARFGVAICSEDNVDTLFREYDRKGAQFVVVLLNNGWFTQKAGFVMHAQHSMVRAAENRFPVIRSANHGWSGLIDEVGGTKEDTMHSLGEKRFFNIELASGREKSPYNNLGDTFCFICVGFVILIQRSQQKR